ncbi:MAG TPA: hypothetical protein VKB34_00110 [Povalibacter sp.]|nr:hypothetical protein [Povalibacter sp.]
MRRLAFVMISLTALAMTAAAEDFDGSKPMVCTPTQGHDCLPGQSECKPLEPRLEKYRDFGFDVGNKTVWSPYRTADLPIDSVSRNAKSLVLQGRTLEVAWTGTIHRTTGRLTVVIADREGAYVVFGQCKLGTVQKPAA